MAICGAVELNLTAVIRNDSSSGVIGQKQANTDYEELLIYCRDTPGVHLIDCPVDSSESDQILNHEIMAL